MKFVVTRICGLALLLSLMGCGGGGDDGVPVSGTVKVEGKPLPVKGCFLKFENEKDIEASKQISVKDDGTFEGQAAPGPTKVYLYGIPAEGGTSDLPSAEKQFNPETVEVKSGEKFDLNFTPAPAM